ncbi:MAG: response regulator transcription factor [Steroidobacteraceae bacterium]
MNLLLVEDDERVRRFVVKGLETEGFSVSVAEDGPQGLEKALTGQHDVIVLDVMLPGLDGHQLCRRLRTARRNTPVLMLTALCATEDKIEGLRGGADDYLTKPFDFDELVARIEALARRACGTLAAPEERLQVGNITIEREARRVRKDGQEVELTSKEYQLLELLASTPGKVLSRSRILNKIWGYDTDPLTNVVDVYVRRLRAKLGWDLECGYIRTVRNFGYRLDP